MRQKVNTNDKELDDLPLSISEELKKAEYISDFTDKIDALVEVAHKTKDRKEKKIALAKAQSYMDAYEQYADRKIYTPVI
jgi:hypothetical protein